MIDEKEWLMIFPIDVDDTLAEERANGDFTQPALNPIVESEESEESIETALIFEAVGDLITNPLTGELLPVLVDLDSWKTFVAMELVTVPKLIGNGSYVESKHVGEREFSFRVSVVGESMARTESAVDNLIKHMLLQLPLKFHRLFLEDGLVIRKETLVGYISGFTDWEQVETHAYAGFSVRCPDPDKTTVNYKADSIETIIGL